MAVGKRGIMGGLSGSVGNIVCTAWKGRAVFKAKPLSVANPRTTPQVNQRTKFSALSVFGSLLLSIWIKPLWDRFAGDVSGYNKFCSLNKANASSSGVLNFDNMIMSKGKMMPPVISNQVADVSLGSVSFDVVFPEDVTWGQVDEQLFCVVVDESTGEILGSLLTTGYPTDSQSFSITCENLVAGHIVAGYYAIKRADGTQVSNSVLVESTTIA